MTPRLPFYAVFLLAAWLAGCATQPPSLTDPDIKEPATASPGQFHQQTALSNEDAADRLAGRDSPLDEEPPLYEFEDLEAERYLKPEDPLPGEEEVVPLQSLPFAVQPPATDLVADTAGPDDIWERLRAGFSLPDTQHPRVVAQREWYAQHQAYLDRTFERSRPFLYFITEEIERRGLPTEIALLPVVESAFQPFAYSHGRAAGIWQFVPGTARRYGLKINWWYDGRRDVYAATHAALSYLEYLGNLFDGDWLHALAAYNSGEGTVRRAIQRNKKHNKPTDFWNLDLPRETRGYVPRLLAISSLVAAPEENGVTLIPIANEPAITLVDAGSQIDVALAARLADMSIEEFYQLNPGINRWATDPEGPSHLLLPLERAEAFIAQLAAVPENERVEWVRHEIRSGQTLSSIANQYQTTVDVVRQANKLRSSFIREGDHLIIPVAQTSLAKYTLSAEQRLNRKQNQDKDGLKVVHIVAGGDTLWDISRKYGVGVRELAKWNGMAPKDTLKVGQKLAIWTKSKQSAGSGPDRTQRIQYTVRKGDSLASIARRFNITVTNIKQWNASTLRKSKYIHPGQRLVLYVDVTRTAETG